MEDKMSKTKFNFIISDWKRVKNHCRTTDNKEFTDNDATEGFKKKLLISEHSPIRLLEFDWSWKSIYYWVSTEWSRHKFEKFISSARDDRGFSERNTDTGYTVWDSKTEKEITYHPVSRNDAPQKNLVNFDGYANMQNIIDAWRKRLCGASTKEAVDLAEDFKAELHKTHPLESDVLVPNCIYRAGCPEFSCCGLMADFIKWSKEKGKEINWLNIQSRYDLYNEFFYEKYNERKSE
jgi:hypothetical protein